MVESYHQLWRCEGSKHVSHSGLRLRLQTKKLLHIMIMKRELLVLWSDGYRGVWERRLPLLLLLLLVLVLLVLVLVLVLVLLRW